MRPIVLPFLFFLACSDTQMKKPDSDQPQSFTTGYADIGPLKMYYEIHGTGGMPLVLIHGGGSTIQTSFHTILPFLSATRQVIALELQGHGHTNYVDRPESFEQDADDVAALLKHLKVNKVDLFGFSNGGSTALQVAIRHPVVVNKLVIASAIYQREGMLPGFFDGMKGATLENMPGPLKTAYLEVAPDKSKLEGMHNQDRDRMIGFKDWSDDDLRKIISPSLVFVGDKDVVLPEHALKMSKLIPNARLMILPGNHGSFMGEICSENKGSKMPEYFAAVVTEFLDGKYK